MLRQLAFEHGGVGGWPADLGWVQAGGDGDLHSSNHTITGEQ